MANSNSIPWAQNPEYLEMSRTHPQPGDLTAYDPPRLIGASPTDVTTFKAGHSRLTLHNLPNVLYVIEPTDEWKQHRALAKPPQKIDPVTEQPLFEHAPRPNTTPRPLLDWPVLRGIEKIGTREDWLFFETMLRLEPGLEWADFDMRMDYVGDRTTRTMSDFVTFVRQRSGRQREKFSILSWAAKSKPGPRELLLARLTPHQVKNNTTRGTTPGLIDPLLSDAPANRIALPKRRNQARFSLASWKTWTDASSVNSASHADRKRKAVTSSEKACPEKSSALDFDKDSEQLLGPKQTGRASSALHSIQRSSPSSFFSYSPYASLVSASTPSREPERGRVEVSGLNHIAEAARLKTELEGKYSWTTIRHTNQSKKRKKDDCDDYLDMNHYGGSLGQRPSKSFRIACRSTSRERAQGIVGFSGERDLPLFQASENDPEDYWLHSDARFFDLSRHNLVEDTASRDRITTIPPNESRIIPLSRKVPEPLPFCDHLH